MGRQAYQTRLALGRSPYGEPLRDDNGNFVIGPHARDNDDQAYKQQFDSRGHPRNPTSKTAARRLRRAQNDVLAAVGVVVRKDEASKSAWEKLSPYDKQKLVIVENQSGRELKTTDRVAGLVASWFIVAFRRRAMTFGFYRELPTSVSLWTEYRCLGMHSVLLAGLPMYLASTLPQMYRYYIRIPDVEEIVNFANPTYEADYIDLRMKLLIECIHSLAFCIEMPLRAFSMLQSLQLIPASAWIPMLGFLPFSYQSPFWLPSLPRHVNIASSIDFLISCSQTPLVISIAQDYLQIYVGYRIYSIIRQITLHAERPDKLSAKVSDEVDIIEETSIPGVGYPRPIEDNTRRGRYYGPKSFLGAFRGAFPLFYSLINTMTGGRLATSRGRLTAGLNKQLQIEVLEECRTRRILGNQHNALGSIAAVSSQREVTYGTFSTFNMDPDEELVDPFAWTAAVLDGMDDNVSSSSRDPEELFDFSEFLREDDFVLQAEHVSNTTDANVSARAQVGSHNAAQSITFDPASISLPDTEQPPDPENEQHSIRPLDNDPSIEVSDDPQNNEHIDLQDILDRAEVHADADQTELSPVQSGVAADSGAAHTGDVDEQPSSPTPGIRRAVSLTDAPLRRTQTATETNLESAHSIGQLSDIIYPREPQLTAVKRNEHRLTLLSAFAVDSFAWHASAIITNIILLPIESMYLRSLAHWAMHSDRPSMLGSLMTDSPMLTKMGGLIGTNFRVLGTGEWFGGAAMGTGGAGRMGYASTILLTIGLEGLIRGGLWYINARRALHRGSKFGWGRF